MYALITGGSRGVGFHIARELKRRGYEIILIARDEERLKKAAGKLNAVYYAIDLSEDYEKVGEVIKEYRPAVVVNNAGFGIYGSIEELSWERLREMINVNVAALTYITQEALKNVRDCHVLNISSVASCRAQKKLAVYAATKAYVEHLSKSLRRDGYRVSYMLLGPTRTDFFRNAGMPTEKFKRIMLSPEKVARYAVDRMLKGKARIVPGILYKLYCLGK